MIRSGASPRPCRRCGRVINPPSDEYGSALCQCGYEQHTVRTVVRLPLQEVVRRVKPGDALIQDCASEAAVQRHIDEAIEACLNTIRDTTSADRSAAMAVIIEGLLHFGEVYRSERERGQQAHLGSGGVVRAIPILLASAYEAYGEFETGVTCDNAAILGQLSMAATDAAELIRYSREIRRGYYTAEVSDGQLELVPTEFHAALYEWQQNRWRLESREKLGPDDEILNRHSVAAQEAWLGFSPLRVEEMLRDRHRILRAMAAGAAGTLYIVAKDECSREYRGLLERMSLTNDRLKSTRHAFFWDLGPAQVVKDVVVNAAESEWLMYYPVIPAVHRDIGECWLVDADVLTHATVNLDAWKGRMLQDIYEAARDTLPSDSIALRRIVESRSAATRQIEKAIGEAAVREGWSPHVSVARIDGAPTVGGEIDAVIVKRCSWGTAVVVCEAKDIDVPLPTGSSYVTHAKKVARAEEQVASKMTGLVPDWRKAILALGDEVDDREGVMLGVVVTPRLQPPLLAERFPLLALGELGPFLRKLEEAPFTYPRLDRPMRLGR